MYGNYNESSKADLEKPLDPIKIYFEEDGDGTKLDSHPKKALLGWLLENNGFHPRRIYPKKIVDFAKKMLSEKTYSLKFAKLPDRKVYYKGIVDFVDQPFSHAVNNYELVEVISNNLLDAFTVYESSY